MNVEWIRLHLWVYPQNISYLLCSKRSLKYATPVCTTISQQKQLYEDGNSFAHYESTSRFIEDNEKTVILSQELSSSRGVSPIYSPTYHLLANAASILRHDGLEKGGSLLCVNDLW